MVTRRQVLKGSVTAAAGLVVFPRLGWPSVLAAGPQTPLAATSIPQFTHPLPSLDVIQAGTGTIELQMREFQAQVLPAGFPRTRVWGYLQPGQTSRPRSSG